MTKYGSAEVKVEFGPTGSLQDVSADILNIGGIDLQAETEEGHGFGEGWVKQLATGLKRGADITVQGFYDDTATTGTHAVFNCIGEARQLEVTYGGGKSTRMDVLVQSYRRIPARGELTKFEAVLLLTGAPTEDPT